MELQLVTFEQAKALKAIGMPVNIQKFCYAGDGNLYYIVNKDFYPAPNLELAAKWLREEKNIHIELTLPNPAYCPWWHCVLRDIKTREVVAKTISYEKDDQALSAGIDKAIEILKSND